MKYLFMITYFASYVTRLNYGAVLVEMQVSTGFSNSSLSFALVGLSVFYGMGQIISGLCGDRFRPKTLVFTGLLVSSILNLLMPLCPSPAGMTALWCANGFALAFLWPPMVRLLLAYYDEEEYQRATVTVSWGSSLGTVAVYLFSPLILTFFPWQGVFVISGVFGILMSFAWRFLCLDVAPTALSKQTEKPIGTHGKFFSPLFLCLILILVMQGALRDGVTTWMPTYVSHAYNLGTSVSILTNVVLPFFSLACYSLALVLYRSKLKNPLTCSFAFFGLGTLTSALLRITDGASVFVSVLLAALLTGAMHGINLMLTCMVPPAYRNTGRISTVSGILNSAAYVGSAISQYGIAAISENFGWNTTLLCWCAIALIGTLLCAVAIRPWRNLMNRNIIK